LTGFKENDERGRPGGMEHCRPG